MNKDADLLHWMGRSVQLRVETPAWTRTKFRADGSVDFVAPLPCPWAYGSLPNTLSGDGDPLDGLLLGDRPARGAIVNTQVQGIVFFIDADADDHKLICAARPLSLRRRVAIKSFFRVYAIAKRALYRAREQAGATTVGELRWR